MEKVRKGERGLKRKGGEKVHWVWGMGDSWDR